MNIDGFKILERNDVVQSIIDYREKGALLVYFWAFLYFTNIIQ